MRNNTQYYSNSAFNRDVISRDTIDKTDRNVSYFILFYKGVFLKSITEEIYFKSLPKELSEIIALKYFLGKLGAIEIWGIDLSLLNKEHSILLSQYTTFLLKEVNFLNTEDAALLAYAQGLFIWNQRHSYCGTCGGKMQSIQQGHSRKCENKDCESLSFPRIDPAVIVLIEYNKTNEKKRCLLNMHALENGYRCSLFSGFVEIGESLEDAALREMQEEVGLKIHNIEYQASQPWPFPATMMIGLKAESNSLDFTIDNDEIKEAKWFSAEELQGMVNDKKIIISKEGSISKFLIEAWLKENSKTTK